MFDTLKGEKKPEELSKEAVLLEKLKVCVQSSELAQVSMCLVQLTNLGAGETQGQAHGAEPRHLQRLSQVPLVVCPGGLL